MNASYIKRQYNILVHQRFSETNLYIRPMMVIQIFLLEVPLNWAKLVPNFTNIPVFVADS
jgi:hypothetical protein